MNTESLPQQKRVRAMGTTLAVISGLALLMWGTMSLMILFSPSTFLTTAPISLPEELAEEFPELEVILLPEGIKMETTVRELMEKDLAFFEAHSGTYRWLVFGWILFFAVVALVIFRMALSWRREDPFGPRTTGGLRWLGILFLAQFVCSFLMVYMVPTSGYGDVVQNSASFDELAAFSGNGATLSCGIVFLTLSWVLEQGRKLKEEQALTI